MLSFACLHAQSLVCKPSPICEPLPTPRATPIILLGVPVEAPTAAPVAVPVEAPVTPKGASVVYLPAVDENPVLRWPVPPSAPPAAVPAHDDRAEGEPHQCDISKNAHDGRAEGEPYLPTTARVPFIEDTPTMLVYTSLG